MPYDSVYSENAIKIMNDRLKPQVNVDSFSLEQAV